MHNRSLLAHVLPLAALMGLMLVGQLISGAFQNSGLLWLARPEFLVFMLQSVVCGAILIFYWREYDFGPLRTWYLGLLVGLIALVIWVSPQAFFGVAHRTEGFDPGLLDDGGALYWLIVISRFARLVIVVPLVEEIFWRGFLMRYLINDNFTKVPFGTYRPFSFFVVAGLFLVEHAPADYIGAICTGLLYNGLAVRSKSLFACVLAHAVTNLGLGLYVMATKQWGFW